MWDNEKWWSLTAMIALISIVLVVWISVGYYVDNKKESFRMAVEAGLVQEQKAGSHGFIWVKGE